MILAFCVVTVVILSIQRKVRVQERRTKLDRVMGTACFINDYWGAEVRCAIQ
jgi:hypothetical protein